MNKLMQAGDILFRNILLIFLLSSLSSFADQGFTNFSVDENRVEDVLGEDDLRNFSPIYSKIINEYESQYKNIGTRLSKDSNGFFGGPNMVGWKHAGDFHAFKVMFNRSAAPSLFDEEQYIVNDEMIIEISAQKFLKKMADEEVIDITQENLAAFAGLSFKRTMRFNHFAPNLQDALQTDFNKLFFMFNYMRPENFGKLSPYDFLKKEDALTFSAGALGSTPLGYGVAIGAGALAKYENKSSVTIQRLGEADQAKLDEILRLSVEDSKIVTAGINITLMADFLNLVKLTLFRYDFEYSFDKSYKTYLSLYKSDLTNKTKIDELKKVTRFGKFNYNNLKENITSSESRKKEIKKSKYLAFILGGVRDSQTESTEVVKDGRVYKFFSHRYEKLQYTQNFLSKMLSIVLGKLIGYDQLVSNNKVNVKNVNLNYESDRELISSRRDFDIFSANVFTMTLGQKNKINKDSRWRSKNTEKVMASLIKTRSNSYKDFAKTFGHYEVKAPAEFTSSIVMDNSNVATFLQKKPSDVYSVFKQVCGGKSKNIFKRLRSIFSTCRSKLYSSYGNFLKEWSTADYSGGIARSCKRKYRWKYLFRRSKRKAMINACMELASKKLWSQYKHELPLWRFKDVVNHTNNYVHATNGLRALFGSFPNKGSVSSNLNGNIPYKNFYMEGADKKNIFTQFQIKENLRSPASF